MTNTPNFNFTIAEGTDTVNLLTQLYPNFTNLDTILQAIKESGTTTAVTTKVGTVHNIVRTVAACNVIRWVATANYAAGDTFTVDGNAVTATAMDGTALPAGAFVINQNVLAILNGSVLTIIGVIGSSTAAGTSYDNTGSGLTATNVQDAIDEVVGDIPANAAALSYDNSGSGLTATNVQDAVDELAAATPGAWTLIGSATGVTPIPFVKANYTEMRVTGYINGTTNVVSTDIMTADVNQYIIVGGAYSGATSGYNLSVEVTASDVKIVAARDAGTDVKANSSIKVYAK